MTRGQNVLQGKCFALSMLQRLIALWDTPLGEKPCFSFRVETAAPCVNAGGVTGSMTAGAPKSGTVTARSDRGVVNSAAITALATADVIQSGFEPLRRCAALCEEVNWFRPQPAKIAGVEPPASLDTTIGVTKESAGWM
jgi:hypothetical protein